MLTGSSVRIGCSGWLYRHWRGTFYPRDLPQRRWLEYYAAQFDTVEINNTFYRLPEATTFDAWRRQAPPGFLFALKASRFLTHMKKLKDAKEPLARLFARAAHLGAMLGPMLYQLPPRWPADVERLEQFLRQLPQDRRHAVEFRDPSWYREAVFSLLRRYSVALCLHDMAGSASGPIDVGPFVYIRFHGTESGGRYSDATLRRWAAWLSGRVRAGVPVFAYFNNDAGGHAPRDAARLKQLML